MPMSPQQKRPTNNIVGLLEREQFLALRLGELHAFLPRARRSPRRTETRALSEFSGQASARAINLSSAPTSSGPRMRKPARERAQRIAAASNAKQALFHDVPVAAEA